MTQPQYFALKIAPDTRVGASPPPWGRVGCDLGFQPRKTREQNNKRVASLINWQVSP